MSLEEREIVHPHLEDLGDLALGGPPALRRPDACEKRGDPEPGGQGLDHGQAVEHLDRVSREPGFLAGLADRGVERCPVVGLAPSSRKRELPAVDAAFAASHQHEAQLTLVVAEQRHQDRRIL